MPIPTFPLTAEYISLPFIVQSLSPPAETVVHTHVLPLYCATSPFAHDKPASVSVLMYGVKSTVESDPVPLFKVIVSPVREIC